MQKTMKEPYYRLPVLSLQEMSAMRIITTLSNNPKLLRLILRCKLDDSFNYRLYVKRGPEWASVQAMASELVSHVCECDKLNEYIMEFLWPVAYRIMYWKYKYAFCIENQFLSHIYWTDQGRIDRRRSILHVIGNRNISARVRFILACIVCLKNEIQEIWDEMTNEDKISFHDATKNFDTVLFWVRTMETPGEVHRSFKDAALMCSFENKWLEAFKYLFTTLSTESRKRIAWEYADNFYTQLNFEGWLEEDDFEMSYFLFFEMNEEYRDSMPFLELTLLLRFSDRDYFFYVFETRLQSMSHHEIKEVLHFIFYKYHLEVDKNVDYRAFFVSIWNMISVSVKNEIRNSQLSFLPTLIRDNFPFLLRKEASKKIAKLTSPASLKSFHRDKWQFLLFLIEEGITTVPTLKLYRSDVIKDLKIRKSNKAAWNRVLSFVRKIGCKKRIK